MPIKTSLLPEFHVDERATGSTDDVAVVIDVLRATSVMAKACQSGVRRIFTCREVDAAFRLAGSLDERPLLGGERGCQRIDGFDFGNSPGDYVPNRVADRTLIMTTTNGTRAIESVERCPLVLTASFLNLSAVIDCVKHRRSVHLVCAGSEGEVTSEDTLLAGAMVWKLRWEGYVDAVDDASTLASELWRGSFPDSVKRRAMPSPAELSRRFRDTRGGRNLVRLGFDADLDRCAEIDSLQAVPRRIARSPSTFEPLG